MRLVILGAGGHGHVVADVARQMGKYSEILFLDDISPVAVGRCVDYPKFADDNTEMYPAIGNNELRLEFENKFLQNNIKLAKIIHPTAYVSDTAIIADGCVVLPYAIVNTNVVIGKACIINCGAIVDHDCILEEGVHIAPNATIDSENQIPQCTKIHAGQAVDIGEYPKK